MTALAAIVLAGAMTLVAVAPAGAATVQDHPAVSGYPGATLSRRDNDGFKATQLVVGVNPAGKTDEEILKTLAIEGKLTRLSYENPRQRSYGEIFANYREALEKAGFAILFACRDGQCGPGWASSRWNRVSGMRYANPEMGYLAAKSTRGDNELYVSVLVAKARHEIHVLERGAMETGLVTARAIADGLLLDGRVVLDGLFFDTDKAVLKPQSRPALETVAQFLKDHPKLEVFIVGHTDATGALEHNLALSQGRAAAVVAALTREHGIAASRLAAHGVGPLAPAKTNQNEPGKTRNRRVEMVQR
ncbi:MAG: OmpA family protein [Rubrivivax sp.]|nr:OmpA family protein [Rubrivivax sp.]